MLIVRLDLGYEALLVPRRTAGSLFYQGYGKQLNSGRHYWYVEGLSKYFRKACLLCGLVRSMAWRAGPLQDIQESDIQKQQSCICINSRPLEATAGRRVQSFCSERSDLIQEHTKLTWEGHRQWIVIQLIVHFRTFWKRL